MQSAPIVVGYDGSDSSNAALDWAVTVAKARRCPLRIVNVVPEPRGAVAGYGSFSDPDPELLVKGGERTLATAVRRVHGAEPGLEIDTRLLVGQVPSGLLDHLLGAEMCVVGSRGLNTFSELLLGSTGFVLATHGTCPVVVVRPTIHATEPAREAGRVVVGVDGSAASTDALGFAFEEASFAGLGLTAVHAWAKPFYGAHGDGGPLRDSLVVTDFEGDEFCVLSESLAGWREKYPDVDVRQVVVHSDAAQALVTASSEAHLLVVGSRGRGGFRSLLLGSVGHAVLHHARCPVAIVRPRAH
jgi:nucleotide-binding universal stress UspA family protein